MTITAGGPTPAATGGADTAELERLDAWWRAANYLSVGPIYLLDNEHTRHTGEDAPDVRDREWPV